MSRSRISSPDEFLIILHVEALRESTVFGLSVCVTAQLRKSMLYLSLICVMVYLRSD